MRILIQKRISTSDSKKKKKSVTEMHTCVLTCQDPLCAMAVTTTGHMQLENWLFIHFLSLSLFPPYPLSLAFHGQTSEKSSLHPLSPCSASYLCNTL